MTVCTFLYELEVSIYSLLGSWQKSWYGTTASLRARHSCVRYNGMESSLCFGIGVVGGQRLRVVNGRRNVYIKPITRGVSRQGFLVMRGPPRPGPKGRKPHPEENKSFMESELIQKEFEGIMRDQAALNKLGAQVRREKRNLLYLCCSYAASGLTSTYL